MVKKMREDKDTFQELFSDPYSGKRARVGRGQKKAIVFLIITGLAVISFGIWHIGRQLKSPLQININQKTNSNQSLTFTNTQSITRIESLREKDTDNDGLTDYDEFYIYKTSPYIADSDSDKIDDKTEIDQGSDPNCPAGTDCARPVTNTNISSNANSLFPELQPEPSAEIDLNNLSADQLRAILRDAGASEESLSQLGDQQLIEAYREIISGGEEATNANTNNGQNVNLENITFESLVNLTPSEIRQLLIDNGVPEETLNLVDDATLQQIYLDSLNQNLKEVSGE